MHKSLELSEDRFFYLTCHSGYKNVKGGTYRVNLKLVDNAGQKTNRLIHGEPYTLRAELTPKDSKMMLPDKLDWLQTFPFFRYHHVANQKLFCLLQIY